MNQDTSDAVGRSEISGTEENFRSIEAYRASYQALVAHRPRVAAGAQILLTATAAFVRYDDIPDYLAQVHTGSGRPVEKSDLDFVLSPRWHGRRASALTFSGFLRQELGRSLRRPLLGMALLSSALASSRLAYDDDRAIIGVALSSMVVALALIASVVVEAAGRLMTDVAMRDSAVIGTPSFYRYHDVDRNAVLLLAGAAVFGTLGSVALVDFPTGRLPLSQVVLGLCLWIEMFTLLWSMVDLLPYYATRNLGLLTRTSARRYFGLDDEDC